MGSLALLVSCQPSSNSEVDVAGYYSGKIPCTGCKDGVINLSLEADGGFTLHENKYNKGEDVTIISGDWEWNGEEVVLASNQSENELAYNPQSRVLKGLTGNIKMRKLHFISKEGQDEITEAFFNQDEVFGGSENWNVRINGNQLFLTIQGDMKTFDVQEYSYAPETNNLIYITSNNVDSIRLTIKNEFCENDLYAGRALSLSLNGIEYQGCAMQPKASFSLDHSWSLLSMNGEDLPDVQFPKGRPVMDINSIDGSFVGKTGCNFWKGRIVFMGDKIQIRPGVMTRMSCPDMDFENKLTQSIGRAWNYSLEGDKLLLTDGEDSMTWKYQE